MKISFFICSIFIIFSNCSCQSQKAKFHSRECIELNDKGTQIMMNITQEGSKDILNAITFFKQAIDCDSSNLIFYFNLANAYDHNFDYGKELDIYNRVLVFSKNNPNIIKEKAIVFEKMNKIDSAKILYKFASKCFRDSLLVHPNEDSFARNLVFVIALTEGREAALKELNRQIALNPKFKAKLNDEFYFYQYFNKKDYIYHITQEVDSNIKDLRNK